MRELALLSYQDPHLTGPVPSQPWASLWIFWHCTVGIKIIFFSFCPELSSLLPPTTIMAVLSEIHLLLSFHVSSAVVVWGQSALWLLLTWPWSLLSFGPVLCLVWILSSDSPLLFGHRIHIPLPSSVSFPLWCFLVIICISAAVSCWITALFSVSWKHFLIVLCYDRGMVIIVPHWARGWVDHCSLAQPAPWDRQCLPAVECSSWCPWEQSYGELNSAEVFSEDHATVLAAFLSTVRQSDAFKILLPSQNGRWHVPELGFHCCQ